MGIGDIMGYVELPVATAEARQSINAVNALTSEMLGELYADRVYKLNTIANFADVSAPQTGDVALVADAKRGGVFVYDATLSTTDNGGTIFDGWVRRYVDGVVNAYWYGVLGDGVNDDATAINLALESLRSRGGVVILPTPTKWYKTGTRLLIPGSVKLEGVGDVNIRYLAYSVTGPAFGCVIMPTSAVTVAVEIDTDSSVVSMGSSLANVIIDMRNMPTVLGTGEFIPAVTAVNSAGLRMNGARHCLVDNILVTGMKGNDCVGVHRVADNYGSGWNNMSKVTAMGLYSKSGYNGVGVGIYLEGIPAKANQANQDIWLNCNTRYSHRGLIANDIGAGQVFINLCSEGNTDNVIISEVSSGGAPIFIGGEFSTAKRINFDGPALCCSSANWDGACKGIDVWVTGASYTGGAAGVGALTIDNGNCYRAIVSHTASADNRPGSGKDWLTYWVSFESRDISQKTMTSVSVTNGVATITTSTDHGLVSDDRVQLFNAPSLGSGNNLICLVEVTGAREFKVLDEEGEYVDASGWGAYTPSQGSCKQLAATWSMSAAETRMMRSDGVTTLRHVHSLNQFDLLGYRPLSITVSEGYRVQPTRSAVVLTSSSGTVKLDATKQIADGLYDGQLLALFGGSSSNKVRVVRGAGVNCFRAFVDIDLYNSITLKWDSTQSLWVSCVDTSVIQASSTELNSVSSDINVYARTNQMVMNSTTKKPVWKTTSGASGTWTDATGSVVHSPV